MRVPTVAKYSGDTALRSNWPSRLTVSIPATCSPMLHVLQNGTDDCRLAFSTPGTLFAASSSRWRRSTVAALSSFTPRMFRFTSSTGSTS